MLDAFSRAVVSADSKGAPIGTEDLAALRQYVADANKRIDATLAITQNVSCIAADAVAGMVCENTGMTQPGGNCYPTRNTGRPATNTAMNSKLRWEPRP